jgi:predicted PurR-regulated permease PerM
MPYMPPAPQRKKMGKGWKIALVLGLVIIALIIVGIVLGAVVFVKVISAPADVANNYVRSINEGDLTTAFSDLATRTQNNTTRAVFDQKMGTFKGNIKKWFTSSININNGRASIVMDISFVDGTKATWDMDLVKENGTWKILNVTPR